MSEALGVCPDGSRPGVLVPAADVSAFGEALGCWLGDAALRRRLRVAAALRRTGLTGWAETAARVSGVLERVAA
ncbi:MAG: hypothetical protein H0W56_10940 [Acidothermales bacterium]|nr:hypothetical protein [Acidothermales bacterium]